MAVSDVGDRTGKWVYAALFVALIPALLVGWAVATADVVPLPVVSYWWAGPVVLGIGALLMLAGTWALWVYGRGLPMSPYPPPVYVARGVYRLTAHPIYVGFAMVCFGVAMVVASPSGLWLVSPAVALACVALVLGFERHEIRRRFGAGVVQRPLIALPDRSAEVDSQPDAHGDPRLGKQWFDYICSTCHGVKGDGYAAGGTGTAIGKLGFLGKVSDGYIRTTIKEGRSNTRMLSFQGPAGLANLTNEEIDDIIVYLRSLPGN